MAVELTSTRHRECVGDLPPRHELLEKEQGLLRDYVARLRKAIERDPEQEGERKQNR